MNTRDCTRAARCDDDMSTPKPPTKERFTTTSIARNVLPDDGSLRQTAARRCGFSKPTNEPTKSTSSKNRFRSAFRSALFSTLFSLLLAATVSETFTTLKPGVQELVKKQSSLVSDLVREAQKYIDDGDEDNAIRAEKSK